MTILRTQPTRRRFLKASALTLGALGMSSVTPYFNRAMAGMPASGKKILYIFLRGGIDGVQAVIPYGDAGAGVDRPGYLASRPSIGVAPEDAHDLNGFCSFHPAMQGEAATDPKMADLFHGTHDERPGQVAVIHRTGYANQNRSHFTSQQNHENASPGSLQLEEGWLNRYLTHYVDEDAPLQAVGLANNQLVALKGDTLVPAIARIDEFDLPANVNLGNFASMENPLGSGLKGAYSQPGYRSSTPYNRLTYDTGVSLLDSVQFFRDNVLSVPYEPEEEAQPFYNAMADGGFRNHLVDAARLLKTIDTCEIVATNFGNFDTHGNEALAFTNLMRDLSLGLTALAGDLKPIWNDVVIYLTSEFGRTSLENGNRGTDHGEATVHVAMGGPVRGGVYNCDPGSWANGDMFSTANGRYLAHRTDYRNVAAELITTHLGDPSGTLDAVIPGYSQLVADDPGGFFTPLGFINAS